MFSTTWIAAAVGIGGGLALAYLLGKAVLPRLVSRTKDTLLVVRMAFAGTVVALMPAILLALVVGATVGGAWGRQMFQHLGVASSGVPFGLAAGVAIVFAAVLVGGAALGALLGRALVYYRQRRI